ncbi:MAG: hypothetical protein JSR62_05335 [Nitrospira sp.]|nr:hypothetical protein [Nitrospira sp.]
MVLPPPGKTGLVLLACLAVGVAEAAPVPPPPAEELDAELLDFLGSWQDEDGRWVDPFSVTNDPVAQPGVESQSNRKDMPADVRKPAEEKPSTSAKDRPRDRRRMETSP